MPTPAPAPAPSALDIIAPPIDEPTQGTPPPPTPTPQPPAEPKAFDVKEPVKNRLLAIFNEGRQDEPATPPEKKEPKAPKAPAAETPAAEPTPETPAEPEKKSTKVKKKASAVDPLEQARVVGAEIAKGIASQTSSNQSQASERSPTPATPPTPSADVPAKHQRKLAILEQMAAEHPDRYGAIITDFKRSVSRLDEYQTQWERSNPGKVFDPEDEEHDAFFRVNDIKYDEDDYAEAIAALQMKPLAEVAKKAEKLEGELADVRKQEKARALEPAIAQARSAGATAMIKAIDPKILEHGKTPETLQAYIEANPDEADIVLGHAQMAGELLAEGVRLLEGGELKPDAPLTKDFFAVKNEIESAIKQQPADEQLDERGRRFLTWQEWIDISAKDPQASNRYWILGKEELTKLIPAEAAKIAKEKMAALDKSFERMAKARGYTKGAPAPAGAKAKNGEPDKAPTPAPTPTPPPAQARTQIDPVKQPNGEGEPAEWRKNLLGVFEGRRV